MRRILMKNYIIIGLVSILVVFGIYMSIKCNQLERENITLKIGHSVILDSIKIENESLHKQILSLSDDLNSQERKIDSLKQIKQKVIIKTEYIISENLTEGVELLKENIRCEKY